MTTETERIELNKVREFLGLTNADRLIVSAKDTDRPGFYVQPVAVERRVEVPAEWLKANCPGLAQEIGVAAEVSDSPGVQWYVGDAPLATA